METTEGKKQEIIADSLIEDIDKLKRTTLGVGAVTCNVCGAEIPEGGRLTAYAFRAADSPRYRLGHVKCPACRTEPTETCTLGVREIVVAGRVGRCRDQATQSSWPVLLNPEPRAVSTATTTDLDPVADRLFLRKTPQVTRSTHLTQPATTQSQPPQPPATGTEAKAGAGTETGTDTAARTPDTPSESPAKTLAPWQVPTPDLITTEACPRCGPHQTPDEQTPPAADATDTRPTERGHEG